MKTVLVIGSHGKVGKMAVKFLSEKGYQVKAMIRNIQQTEEMKSLGAEPVIADLEEDITRVFENVDVVIFTAGSGSHTGPDKTILVDQDGAVKSVKKAVEKGIERYIMVSAQGARDPEKASAIQHYFKAKRNADDFLIQSGLEYTVFRPGRLTDEKGDSLIRASTSHLSGGNTKREDLARAIAESVNMKNLFRTTIEILEGEKEIKDALLAI